MHLSIKNGNLEFFGNALNRNVIPDIISGENLCFMALNFQLENCFCLFIIGLGSNELFILIVLGILQYPILNGYLK